MKKTTFFLLLVFVMIFQIPALARMNDEEHFYLDLGGLRNSYFYPVMDLGYRSPRLFNMSPVNLEARLRSYGTYFLYNPYSYDFTLAGRYCFPVYRDLRWDIQTHVGLGLEARLRGAADVRSRADSSLEPLWTGGVEGTLDDFKIYLPLWVRCYSDGVSFQILPEISWRWNAYGVFIRSELAFLALNDKSRSGWIWNNFAGFQIFL